VLARQKGQKALLSLLSTLNPIAFREEGAVSVNRPEILKRARRRRPTGYDLPITNDGTENRGERGGRERVNGREGAQVASAAETFELSRLRSSGCDGLLILLPIRDATLGARWKQ
jgi:hypothetical protein